jgi:serine protease
VKPSIRKVLSILAVLALPAIAAAPVARDAGSAGRRAAIQAEDPRHARVIVKYRSQGSLMRESARAARAGAEARVQHAARLSQRLGLALVDGHEIAPRTQVLHAHGLRSSELVARLKADPDVEYAEVDQRVRIAAAPNDPLYPGGQTSITPEVGQWYLRAPDATFVSAIGAEAAWDITPGSPAIVVAVLDTGVRPDHPDLAGKLLPGYDFVSEDSTGVFSTANDGDGRDADPSDPGDWVTAAEDAEVGGVFHGCSGGGAIDSSWHGTQTAGLSGAATDNGIGMASVGRNVRVLPVRVLGKCGGYLSDVVAGMRWAAGLSSIPVANPNPARIVNLSLGSTGPCAGTSYESAVSDLVAAGVVVVAAAGNDTGRAVGKPANCAGAIGVGGLRHIGTKVGYSDLGAEIAISAPAGNCVNESLPCLYPLLTTTNTGATIPAAHTYSSGGNDASIGTSFSAPLVTGTVALMLSANPALTPAQVRAALMSSARPFPTSGADPGTPVCVAPNGADQYECYCTTGTCGAGMLSASAATQAASTLTAWATASALQVVAGSPVVLDSALSWAVSPQTITSRRWSIEAGTSIASITSPPTDVTAVVETSAGGTVVVRLTITDSAGAQARSDTTVTVAEPPAPPPSSGGGGALQLGWALALLAAVLGLARSR